MKITLKKIKVFFAVVAILIVCFFIVYFIAYQRLIDQGSVIADNQCLKVNPIIIERKNSYLASIKVFQATGSVEEYLKETENYFSISQKYVEAERVWLMEQKAHMDRWNFQLIVPSYQKDAAKAQYASREATVNSAQALKDAFETKDLDRQKELTKVVIDQTNKAKEAEDEYNRIANTPRGFNLLTRLTKVPESNCPPENLNIPDVPDMLTPKSLPANNGQPLS